MSYAQGWKVGEQTGEGKCAVVCVELEAYPEPKCLTKEELQAVVLKMAGIGKAGRHIGASESFVRQNA